MLLLPLACFLTTEVAIADKPEPEKPHGHGEGMGEWITSFFFSQRVTLEDPAPKGHPQIPLFFSHFLTFKKRK